MALPEAARDAARRIRDAPQGTLGIRAAQTGDGLASAAIMARALGRLGRPFHVRFVPPGRDAAPDDEPPHIVLDLDTAPAGPLLVHVHHGPAAGPAPTASLNPRLLGEAERSASSSTAALAVAVALDEANWDMSALALAGAQAEDLLDPAAGGWNDAVMRRAQRDGRVTVRTELRLGAGPLADVLARPADGLVAALPGGAAEARAFLQRYGLPPHATAAELSDADRRTLATALLYAHLRSGAPAAHAVRALAPGVHAGAPYDLPLPALAGLLAGACLEDEAGLALAWLLGDDALRAEVEAASDRAQEHLRRLLRDVRPAGDAPLLVGIPRPDYLEAAARALAAVGDGAHVVVAHAVDGDRGIVCLHAPDPLVRGGAHALRLIERARQGLSGSATGHAAHARALVRAQDVAELVARLGRELAPRAEAVPA